MDRTPRFLFEEARKAEVSYGRQLRQIARQIGDIVSGNYDPNDHTGSIQSISDLLENYAELIEPWARAAAARMVTEVGVRNRKAWHQTGKEMGRLLAQEINDAPIGQIVQQRMADQVSLITSMPRDAARRVQQIASGALYESIRPENIVAEIMRTGQIAKGRAMLIARTETGRTATELTKARAEHVGSTEFVWRTVKDADVRPTHRRLEGRTFRWDDPPECDPGYHALPGAIFNCRCWPEPVIQ